MPDENIHAYFCVVLFNAIHHGEPIEKANG